MRNCELMTMNPRFGWLALNTKIGFLFSKEINYISNLEWNESVFQAVLVCRRRRCRFVSFVLLWLLALISIAFGAA